MAEQEQKLTPPVSGGTRVIKLSDGTIVIKLSRFLSHGDDEITALSLRQPTVEDVADLGYPFSLIVDDGDTRMEVKAKTVLKYASRLAAVPPSVLKGMALADFMATQTEIMGFFGDMGATPPS
jgi:hypothetical protein